MAGARGGDGAAAGRRSPAPRSCHRGARRSRRDPGSCPSRRAADHVVPSGPGQEVGAGRSEDGAHGKSGGVGAGRQRQGGRILGDQRRSQPDVELEHRAAAQADRAEVGHVDRLPIGADGHARRVTARQDHLWSLGGERPVVTDVVLRNRAAALSRVAGVGDVCRPAVRGDGHVGRRITGPQRPAALGESAPLAPTSYWEIVSSTGPGT